MEKELDDLIDKLYSVRGSLGHHISTATQLGYSVEVKHLQDLRSQAEDFYFEITSIKEKYLKEKTKPTPKPADSDGK